MLDIPWQMSKFAKKQINQCVISGDSAARGHHSEVGHSPSDKLPTVTARPALIIRE